MSKPVKHANNGMCSKCLLIKLRYNHFDEELWKWFQQMQATFPELHISCAGRDEHEQEQLFIRGATKAHFGKSAHNYGAALDLFVIQVGSDDIYPKTYFDRVVGGYLPPWLEWYGKPGSSFYELPHVEIKNWKELVKGGALKLIDGGS